MIRFLLLRFLPRRILPLLLLFEVYRVVQHLRRRDAPAQPHAPTPPPARYGVAPRSASARPR